MRRIKYLMLLVLALLMAFSSVWATGAKHLLLRGVREFGSGRTKNLSIDKLGRLSLSPQMDEIFHNQDLLVHSVVKKSNTLYIGTGNRDTLYAYNLKTKKHFVIFNGNGLAVNALAIIKNKLYFAESPTNRIYEYNLKTKKRKEIAVFSDETYIWKIVAYKNKLYIATGDSANIYELSSNGKKKKIFSNSKESHFMALAAYNNSLYFGGTGLGSLYRYSLKSKRVKVLYDCYEGEISDIFINNKSELFFTTSSQTAKLAGKDFDYTDAFLIQGIGLQSRTKSLKQSRAKRKRRTIKNSVYRYYRGKIDKLFTRDRTVFYSVAQGKDKKLYIGGARGVIHRFDLKKRHLEIYMDLKEDQIQALLPYSEGLFVGTKNMGKVYDLSYNYSKLGEYYSRIKDLRGESKIGSLSFESDIPRGTKVEIFVRGGNSSSVDSTWSKWTGPYSNSEGNVVGLKDVRYLQYKIVLRSFAQFKSPSFSLLRQPYMTKNRAPSISYFRSYYERTKNPKKARYLLLFRWNAYDSDRDFLVYRLYFREKNDLDWMLLGPKYIKNKIFRIDTRALPDGEYEFRLEVSDERSNVVFEKESRYAYSPKILVDNKSPEVKNLSSKKIGNYIRIEGAVKDSNSYLTLGYYSLNAGVWTYFLPNDSIYDSKKEKFTISIPLKELDKNKKYNIIFIRFFDSSKNQVSVRLKIDGQGRIIGRAKASR